MKNELKGLKIIREVNANISRPGLQNFLRLFPKNFNQVLKNVQIKNDQWTIKYSFILQVFLKIKNFFKKTYCITNTIP